MRQDIYDPRYDQRWLSLAREIAGWSEDLSTKVGCVVFGTSDQILTTGYNGFPRGIFPFDERFDRPAKYQWTEHGERNAIYNAARSGISLVDATLVVAAIPSLYPCVDCARGIVQSGIKVVVCNKADFDHPKWGASFRTASDMFYEAGVTVREY